MSIKNIFSVIHDSAVKLLESNNILIFTGAGISIESGIQAFRGNGGLWNEVDPIFCDIDYFYQNPKDSWEKLKKYFYQFYGKAKPNPAHYACTELQKIGMVKRIITQNIDGLHTESGSVNVIEYHGSLKQLVCQRCGTIYQIEKELISAAIPLCPQCKGILKPNIVFFGEGIPEKAAKESEIAANSANAIIICGTTGEVMPACQIPYIVSEHNGLVIEINPLQSSFTKRITDYHIEGKAGEVFPLLVKEIKELKNKQ